MLCVLETSSSYDIAVKVNMEAAEEDKLPEEELISQMA